MRRFLMLVALVGCHSPGQIAVAPVPARRQPPAVRESAPVAPESADPCEGLGRVVVTAPAIELQCEDQHRSCRGTTTVAVRNCTAASVELVELQVRQGEEAVVFTPAASPLSPGSSWTKAFSFYREGTHSVVATLREDGGIADTEPVQLHIDNPARDAALAACNACDGEWGVYGIRSIEACNCATTDGAKVCHDGDDCEASCMFERFEVVRPGSRACAPNGSCAVEFELGRPVGRCNPRAMSFGCKSRIKSGASKAPPVVLPARAPMQCVD